MNATLPSKGPPSTFHNLKMHDPSCNRSNISRISFSEVGGTRLASVPSHPCIIFRPHPCKLVCYVLVEHESYARPMASDPSFDYLHQMRMSSALYNNSGVKYNNAQNHI